MKNIFLTPCFILLYILNLQSQTFTIMEVDEAPVIGDCEAIEGDKECFEEFIKLHVQKTMDIRKLDLGENGKAYVQFEITKEGKIENVRVRATDAKLQKETRRIIEKIKIKEPAKKGGTAVTLLHTIPVTFNNLSYSSYNEFFAQEKAFSNGFGPSQSLKDAAHPPVFKECTTAEDARVCFKNTTELKIRSFLNANAIMKELVEPGDVIKFYFEVSADSGVKNPIVVFNKDKVRTALTNFLATFKFESSALDKENKPLPIYYQENLIF